MTDHVVVCASGGFDAEARTALDGVTRLWIRDRHAGGEPDEPPDVRQEWRLALEGFGTPEAFEDEVPFLRASRAWISAAPFLASGHLKGAATARRRGAC